ncbi:MAG: co-chaperone GroES [Actinomycetaceae bacterium]|nr:co-chaperone GroES [Actinomycetaceae bacterium]
MSVSIKPLQDRVVVKQIAADTTTASGLVLPDTATEKKLEGEVVALGPVFAEEGHQSPLKVGDKVIFARYGGTDVKYGVDEYIILSENDILAIVED